MPGKGAILRKALKRQVRQGANGTAEVVRDGGTGYFQPLYGPPEELVDVPQGLQRRAARLCKVIAEALADVQAGNGEQPVELTELAENAAVQAARKEFFLGKRGLGNIVGWYPEVFHVHEGSVSLLPDYEEQLPTAPDDDEDLLPPSLEEATGTWEDKAQAFRIEAVRALIIHGGSLELHHLGQEPGVMRTRRGGPGKTLVESLRLFPDNFRLQAKGGHGNRVVALLSEDVTGDIPPPPPRPAAGSAVVPSASDEARSRTAARLLGADGGAPRARPTSKPAPKPELPDEETLERLPQWCREAIMAAFPHVLAAAAAGRASHGWAPDGMYGMAEPRAGAPPPRGTVGVKRPAARDWQEESQRPWGRWSSGGWS